MNNYNNFVLPNINRNYNNKIDMPNGANNDRNDVQYNNDNILYNSFGTGNNSDMNSSLYSMYSTKGNNK